MMTDRFQCPHCGKSVVPVEKWVVVWKKGILRKNLSTWIVPGLIGLLMVTLGIILLILFRLSSVGLIGAATAIVGGLIVVSLVLRYLRIARSKQRRHVCPLCRYHWSGQSIGRIDTEGLEKYFTNVEHLRVEFETLVTAPTLSRRLFIIHGVGGVGKSSLLRMFRLYCRKHGVPVALSSGDEAKSPVDVLSDWAKDLAVQGITLPAFTEILNEYRAIQEKVKEQAKVEQRRQGDTSKTAIKTAVQVASSLAGIIPGVGLPLSIVLGGTSDTLVDWLHGFLPKPQIDLLLDPTDKLTESFLNDLEDVIAQTRETKSNERVVLLLDTLDQIAFLSRWVCNFAQRLHPSALLVFAGRTVPDWERPWPGWTAQAKLEELKPMTAEVIRELIHRYYATQRSGEPDPVQVEAIVSFARGLPIAVTAIVQLWVQYGIEDFQAVRPQVVSDLVDQLTRGIPDRVRPVLKAAATLRWFNEELLAVVLGDSILSDEVYEELRRFPFVRSRKQGLALHDSVREHLDDNLRLHEPARHREMHERAANYFKLQLEKSATAKGDEAMELALEELYHRILADEREGIKQFREVAQELVDYQLLNQLLTLLNDVHNYPLREENSLLWQDYYRAKLRELKGRPSEAEPIYQAIADNEQAEQILRAYALCDWAYIARLTSLDNMEQILERLHHLYPEPESVPEPEAKLGFYLLEQSNLCKSRGKWSDAFTYLERARTLYERIGDLYGLLSTSIRREHYYLDQGMWKEGISMQRQGLQEVAKVVGEQQQSYLRAEFLGRYSMHLTWTGQYCEIEKRLQEALNIAERFQRIRHQIYFLRDLAFVLGLQGKVGESTERFAEATRLEIDQKEAPLDDAYLNGFRGLIALKWLGAEQAEQYFTISMNKLREVSRREWHMPPFLNWHGAFYEVKGELESAERCYRECLSLHSLEQWYWYVGALTGLMRIYYAREDSTGIDSVLHHCDQLAQRYEYNDYMASLRLIQGHMAWDGQFMTGEQGFDGALHFYQQALIYALRYNRFLLDEVLSGRPQGTVLQPIIPHCLKRGKEGQSMLQTLRDWWQNGINDVDKPRSDSISPIREDISLLEGERLARDREKGDGSIQPTVTEQFVQALTMSSR
jgi:tetratricopeptide (TPR) repeat protein